MKRLVFISNNRILIERVTALISSSPNLHFMVLSISWSRHIVDDIKIFGSEVVIIDVVSNRDFIEICSLCKQLRDQYKEECLIFLCISQNETEERYAKEMIKEKLVDDCILGDDIIEAIKEKLSKV